ncbi:DUF2777 domain-containing protein [Bacillus shivajii]|uniref:DUF2777 family protein n=1 Tax=Bacillus shivajii TaxID=1983719 RepID=UPI001CFB65DC|nr:DUF2777 family protein [Bacillus shivajii]UCZ54844.1 DUF2777 domain-containing protein [Bacillus shivajii]
MNRNEAKQHIGKHVVLNHGKQGTYIAILKDLKLKPNVPWRAVVEIIGVQSIPELFHETVQNDLDKVLEENELIECPGTRIEPLNEPFNSNYTKSLALALKEKWDQIQEQNEQTETLMNYIQHELRRLKCENLLFEGNFIYYQLVKKGNQFFIYDEQKKEALSIDGCPFEFEINVNGNWVPGIYLHDTTFEIYGGKQVELQHGSTVRLNKTQFDPYQILLNELDEASLTALEKALSKLGIGHEHSVYCHNSLLMQLLNSFENKDFSGVNFISYANKNKQYVLQHHYERSLKDDRPDVTYDRFEFTSDTGERLLATYATQLSNE